MPSSSFNCPPISSNYLITEPTLANVLLYLLVLMRLPVGIFPRALRSALPASAPQRRFPFTLFLVSTIYYFKRALLGIYSASCSHRSKGMLDRRIQVAEHP